MHKSQSAGRVLCAFALLLIAPSCTGAPEVETSSVDLPFYEFAVPLQFPVRLTPTGRLSFDPINESSGLTASRKSPGVYWTHNDSGDWARIFAIREDGTIVAPPANLNSPFQGFRIEGARNKDWESICTDNSGNLIIADTGNNANRRKDLGFYIVPEFDPSDPGSPEAIRHIKVFFPDQDMAQKRKKNYDCEAVFFAHGKIHVLTKHRADANSTLYRLDSTEGDQPIPLTPLARYVSRDMVTGADCTPDGKRLAVLTLDAIWVFDAPENGIWFEGRARRLPILAGQCEAITWKDDSTLLVTNEQRNIFTVDINNFVEVLRVTR